MSPHETDPFNPVGSVCLTKSLPSKYRSFPVTASKWYVRVCLSGNYLTSAHVLFKTKSLRLTKIRQVVLTPIRYVPVHIDTEYIEYMMFSHAYIF